MDPKVCSGLDATSDHASAVARYNTVASRTTACR